MDELIYNNEIKEFFDSLEELTKIDEDELNEETMAQFEKFVIAQMTGSVQKQSVNEILKNLEAQGSSKQEAADGVAALKKYINEKIYGEKVLGPKQKQLIDGVLKATYDIFDKAVEMYHNYAIELPIKLEEGAQMPTYAYDTDAAADLYVYEDTNLNAHTYGNLVRTGVSIQLPEGWLAFVMPRSGMSKNTPFRISNSVGLIDSGYRGEIGVLLDNTSEHNSFVKKGTRIAQLLVMPSYRFQAKQVDSLEDSDRGTGGFGSTGN